MPILGLNTRANIYRVAAHDQSGDVIYAPPVPTLIAVIKMSDLTIQSPVRSEASASHGRDEEATGNVIALFQPNVQISIGDRVDTLNTSLQVILIYPNEDSFGRLNHLEVTLKSLATDVTDTYAPVVG